MKVGVRLLLELFGIGRRLSSNTMSPNMRGPIAVATGVGIASFNRRTTMDGVSGKLVLGTLDGSSKRDFKLLKEAMPKPVATAIGPLNFSDIVLDDPTTWEFKAPNNAEQFKGKADPLSSEEILLPKKARRN